MTLLDNLTSFSDQQTILLLPDGTSATLELRFCGATERWFANLSYLGKSYDGIGLCCDPNVLRQWKNVIPFGIACVTSDQTDPVNSDDFATGRVQLFLLDAADVQAVESTIFGAVS